MKNLRILLFIFFVNTLIFSQTDGDYRTKGKGYWNTTSIWQIYNVNLKSWRDSSLYPETAAYNISISCWDTLIIPFALKLDSSLINSVTVLAGGKLIIESAIKDIELSSFLSVINGSEVTLNWRTLREINNKSFNIERKQLRNTTISKDTSWILLGTQAGKDTSLDPRSYSYTDKDLQAGKYSYRLSQVSVNGKITYFYLTPNVDISVPGIYSVSQNYPNPSNPASVINYTVGSNANVSIKVYDISGREVKTLVERPHQAGKYSVKFDGSDLASGVYFYHFVAIDQSQKLEKTLKLILVK